MNLLFLQNHLLQLIHRFEQQQLPLDLFMNHYFRSYKSLGAHDRKWIAEHVYGMFRYLSLLNYLTDASWEARLAAFMKLDTKKYVHQRTIPEAIRWNIPQALLTQLKQQWPLEKIEAFCLLCLTQAPTTLRVNTIKTTRQELLKAWAHLPLQPCVHVADGITSYQRFPFTSFKEFKLGYFEIQDEGSQLIASKIKVKPGDLVLDYCAGSGGKSLAIAPRMQQQGQLFLHDIRTHSLQQAKIRLKRAGIFNAQCLVPQHPFLNKLKGKINTTIVDAPCSGTGTYRRHPEMKWKFDRALLSRLIETQRIIFDEAYTYMAKKGDIAYITCSVLEEENKAQVDYFLQKYPLTLVETVELFPQEQGMDGFFLAMFHKQ